MHTFSDYLFLPALTFFSHKLYAYGSDHVRVTADDYGTQCRGDVPQQPGMAVGGIIVEAGDEILPENARHLHQQLPLGRAKTEAKPLPKPPYLLRRRTT